MTPTLGRFLSCSAALHMALLAAWHAVPGPGVLAEHSAALQVVLAAAPAAAPPVRVRPAPSARPERAAVPEPAPPRPPAAARPPVPPAPVAAHRATTPAAAAPAPAEHETDRAARAIATAAEPAAEKGAAPAEALLRDSLTDELRRHLAYPLLARRNGWEGTVELGVRITGAGRLTDIRIVQSSGHRVLDDAALRGLRRVTAIAAPSGLIAPSGREVILPVEYRLIDA